MKIDIKLPPVVKKVLGKFAFIAKHHYVIVMVLLFGGLSVGVYMVNATLQLPTDDTYRAEQLHSTIGSKFTQATKDTIEKIKALQKTSDTNSPVKPLPDGRINPFAE